MIVYSQSGESVPYENSVFTIEPISAGYWVKAHCYGRTIDLKFCRINSQATAFLQTLKMWYESGQKTYQV